MGLVRRPAQIALLVQAWGLWKPKPPHNPWEWLPRYHHSMLDDKYASWCVANGKPIAVEIVPSVNRMPYADFESVFFSQVRPTETRSTGIDPRLEGTWQEVVHCTRELQKVGWMGGEVIPRHPSSRRYRSYRVARQALGKRPLPLMLSWRGWVQPSRVWREKVESLPWINRTRVCWATLLNNHPRVTESLEGVTRTRELKDVSELLAWVFFNLFEGRTVKYVNNAREVLESKFVLPNRTTAFGGFSFDMTTYYAYICGDEMVYRRGEILSMAILGIPYTLPQNEKWEQIKKLIPELGRVDVQSLMSGIQSRHGFLALTGGPKEFPWLS